MELSPHAVLGSTLSQCLEAIYFPFGLIAEMGILRVIRIKSSSVKSPDALVALSNTYLPSGLKTTKGAVSSRLRRAISFPVCASQMRVILSSLEITYLPSGLKATVQTTPLCGMVAICFPESISHTRAVLSPPPETTYLLSVLTAADQAP